MYTLVVVDMQPDFRSANGNRVLKNCRREIDRAIEIGAHILFLEYCGYQPTIAELTLSLHEKCIFRRKNDDDGSAEIENEVRLNRLPKHFRVCGVNTDCCVFSTVRGLTARFPMSNIDVVADACNSDWNHNAGLSKIENLKGLVKLIREKEG